MMDKLEMAKNLLSHTRYSNPGQTTTAHGIASTDSSNGIVIVDMGGDTVSPDDDQSIECETTFKIYEGDEVIVSLIGADGSGKVPVVTGVVGRGDETQVEIDNIKNYFWTDDHGAHVSTVEQSVEGANVLLDSDSLDIRIGRSNNHSDQNVVARFGRNSAFIAGVDGTKYWQVKDLRSASTRLAPMVDVFGGDPTVSSYQTNFFLSSVTSVVQNKKTLIEGTDYNIDYGTSTINYTKPLPLGSFNEISYLTSDGVFEYDEGIRKGTSGPYSKIVGFKNTASGPYSEAHGYFTESNAMASTSDGYMTKANGSMQKVFGKGNVPDNDNKYAEIVGNGIYDGVNTEESFILVNGETQVLLNEPPIKINKVILNSDRINIKSYIDHIQYEELSSINGGDHGYWLYFTQPFEYSIKIYMKHIQSGKEYTFTVSDGSSSVKLPLSFIPVYPSSSDEADTNIENYEFYAYLDNYFCSGEDYIQDDDNPLVVLLGDRIIYYSSLFNEIRSEFQYMYGDIIRSNAYELDWDGNANFKGEVYLGGCNLNGETPYPALRYNTLNETIEYFGPDNKGKKVWQEPNIMHQIIKGKIVGVTDYRYLNLPAGSVCMIITEEYNSSTFKYRGHRAKLLRIPKPIMYGYQKLQMIDLAKSTNAGTNIINVDNSSLGIASTDKAYTVDYTVYNLINNHDLKYYRPVVVNGKVTSDFLNSFLETGYVTRGEYYFTRVAWYGSNSINLPTTGLKYSYRILKQPFVIKSESLGAKLILHSEIRTVIKSEYVGTKESFNLYIGFVKSKDPPILSSNITTEAAMIDEIFLKYSKITVTKTSTINYTFIDGTDIVGEDNGYLMILAEKISWNGNSFPPINVDIYSMGQGSGGWYN